jgi:hypothetical protein
MIAVLSAAYRMLGTTSSGTGSGALERFVLSVSPGFAGRMARLAVPVALVDLS